MFKQHHFSVYILDFRVVISFTFVLSCAFLGLGNLGNPSLLGVSKSPSDQHHQPTNRQLQEIHQARRRSLPHDAWWMKPPVFRWENSWGMDLFDGFLEDFFQFSLEKIPDRVKTGDFLFQFRNLLSILLKMVVHFQVFVFRGVISCFFFRFKKKILKGPKL